MLRQLDPRDVKQHAKEIVQQLYAELFYMMGD